MVHLFCTCELNGVHIFFAGMLDHVTVMSHGVRSPLAHVAAVSMPNMETLTVMPYDQSVSFASLVAPLLHLSTLTLSPHSCVGFQS